MNTKTPGQSVLSVSRQAPAAALTHQCPDCRALFSTPGRLARHQVRRHARTRAARSR